MLYMKDCANHLKINNEPFQKNYTKAWNEKDITAFMECHHDDYELVIHSTGEVKKMEDIDWDKMME